MDANRSGYSLAGVANCIAGADGDRLVAARRGVTVTSALYMPVPAMSASMPSANANAASPPIAEASVVTVRPDSPPFTEIVTVSPFSAQSGVIAACAKRRRGVVNRNRDRSGFTRISERVGCGD